MAKLPYLGGELEKDCALGEWRHLRGRYTNPAGVVGQADNMGGQQQRGYLGSPWPGESLFWPSAAAVTGRKNTARHETTSAIRSRSFRASRAL